MSGPVATVRSGAWRLRPSVLRAAWWAYRATVDVRHQLARGASHPTVEPPPALPPRAGLGVDAVIGRLRATCLEGAMVRQRWLVSQGDARDVVIGLPTASFGEVPAHAWVDGLDVEASEQHVELYRIEPPR